MMNERVAEEKGLSRGEGGKAGQRRKRLFMCICLVSCCYFPFLCVRYVLHCCTVTLCLYSRWVCSAACYVCSGLSCPFSFAGYLLSTNFKSVTI